MSWAKISTWMTAPIRRDSRRATDGCARARRITPHRICRVLLKTGSELRFPPRQHPVTQHFVRLADDLRWTSPNSAALAGVTRKHARSITRSASVFDVLERAALDAEHRTSDRTNRRAVAIPPMRWCSRLLEKTRRPLQSETACRGSSCSSRRPEYLGGMNPFR